MKTEECVDSVERPFVAESGRIVEFEADPQREIEPTDDFLLSPNLTPAHFALELFLIFFHPKTTENPKFRKLFRSQDSTR